MVVAEFTLLNAPVPPIVDQVGVVGALWKVAVPLNEMTPPAIFGQYVESFHALTIGLGKILIFNVLVTAAHKPLKVEVSVKVTTPPAAISAALIT